MAKGSLSKIISNATTKATKTVSDLKNVSSETLNTISKTTDDVVKCSVELPSKVIDKLSDMCNPNNVVPCLTAIILIVYIVVVNPKSVLDMFSSPFGKFISMFVVLITLLFDIRLGVMLGFAVVLSINMASTRNDMQESFVELDDVDFYIDDKLSSAQMEPDENLEQKMDKTQEMSDVTEVPEKLVMSDTPVMSNNITGFDSSNMYSSLTDDDEIMS